MKITIPSILGVIFVTLKLTHYIEWSWLWVLAPFWVPFVGVILFLLGCLGVLFVIAFIDDIKRKKGVRVK